MRKRERRSWPAALILTGAIAVAILVGPPALGAELRSASGLSGTWSGKYSGAYHGTLRLQWTQSGSQLSGTIKLSTSPNSRPSIKGSVHGSTIRFGTVGSAAITYSGSVSGKSMSGRYRTPGGGGSWSAHKTS